MKILGMGIPEFVIILFLAAPIIVALVVISRSRRSERAANDAAEAVRDIGPGWYRDPDNLDITRWWDGSRWTEATSDSEPPTYPVQGHAGWYEDPQGTGRLQWWDGGNWLEDTRAKPSLNLQPQTRGPEDMPVVRNWETSALFSVLGELARIIAGPVLMLGASLLLGAYFGPVLMQSLLSVVSIVYAAAFYPSFFGEKSRIASNKAISFCNFMFGGVLFGALWNCNLTKSRLLGRSAKGVSYIVLIVESGVSLVMTVLLVLLFAGAYLSESGSYSAAGGQKYAQSPSRSSITSSSQAESPVAEIGDTGRYIDHEIGVSFVLPEGWHSEDLSESYEYARWEAYPNDTDYACILYGVVQIPGSSTGDLAEKDLKGMIADGLTGCTDETVERVTLGEYEYWAIRGTGSLAVSDEVFPASITMLIRADDGVMVSFQFYDFSGTDELASYYDDFIELVSGAVYAE